MCHHHSLSTVHDLLHYPPHSYAPQLEEERETNILSSVSISKTGEWKRSRAHVRDSLRFRSNLRPWGERYYEEEHSFLTKGATTCSAFAHVRPLSIETTPTVLRRGGMDSSGVRFIASSTLFSPTRHRENSTMHATKIVTGEKMPRGPMMGEILRFNPFFF